MLHIGPVMAANIVIFKSVFLKDSLKKTVE